MTASRIRRPSLRPFSPETKRGRSQHQHIRDRDPQQLPERAKSNHEQETRIMAFNEHRLKKLLSDDPKSSFGHTSPKIQQVQPYLRKRNPKYYSPNLVSIGPIHHDKRLLPEGEKYKSMWAAMYLEGRNQEAEQLFQKIVVDLPTLKAFYTKDTIEGHDDEYLAWIFFLDGCAVLNFMEKFNDDPQKLMIKVDQMVIVTQDLLLLENQLPFLVFKLLSNHDEPDQLFSVINKFFITFNMISGGVQWKENNITFNMITGGVQEKENNTTGTHDSTICEEVRITVDQSTHLLHYLHNEFIKKKLLDRETQVERKGDKLSTRYTHRNIQELKASGIQVKKNKKNAMSTHIYFETSFYFWGKLYLSDFCVETFMASFWFNMTAFEMCPDFVNNYEISSYIAFLDSLIDNEDDVKELRKVGVLRNLLGSDEEVAMLFNNISFDSVPHEEIYQEVREKMERHYKSKKKTWMAQAWYNYFSNPWSFLAFLAALTALILTLIQTWFAVYPSRNA